ncbi:MAG: amidohydrolase family protein [Gammaproteobacteria bacterium]|nr:amidohydrolase family protein [Gammaproteobacteria bacterium]
MFDIVLSNGTVYDGSGADGLRADVAVKDGRIAAIGLLADAQAAERVDVSGLAVAPGFVDLHTHSDFTLVVNGAAESQVHQGVTTEVIGQCGFSCAPLRSSGDLPVLASGYGIGVRERRRWRTFAEYLDVLQSTPLGVNVAALVGHSTVHQAVLGDALKPGDPEDVAQMKRLVEESLDGGAAGFSTGLEYWPGIMAAPEHLVPLCEAAAQRGKLYATHVRNRDRYYDLGFAEALAAARLSGARLQISHIQTKFGAPAHAMEHTLEMVHAARRHGTDVAIDVIPHDWNNTTVISILPKWAREGGTEQTLARLRDPSVRERVKANPAPMLLIVAAGQWDRIVLLNASVNAAFVGASFAEIGKARGVDPYDALMDMLIEEGDAASRMLWATQSFTDADVEMAMRDSSCAVISDTAALAPYGDLADELFSLSGYGWAARFLQYYVRDRKVLPLAEAIRRITSLPAERIGLRDRGSLRPGQCADVTVFDPALIESRFSAKAPRAYPTGIAHVLVNGVFSMRDGARTEGNAGQVLRDAGH